MGDAIDKHVTTIECPACKVSQGVLRKEGPVCCRGCGKVINIHVRKPPVPKLDLREFV